MLIHFLNQMLCYLIIRKPVVKIFSSLFLYTTKLIGYNNYRNYYQTGELYFIKNILSKHNITFSIDVGANAGSYSALIAKYTNSYILAIEPNRDLEKIFWKQLAHFGERIKLVHEVIFSQEREVTFQFNPFESSKSSIVINNSTNINDFSNIKIKSITLDILSHKLDFKVVDFIKVDVEGFELEVLLGAVDTIKSYQPKFIQIEINPNHCQTNSSLFKISKHLDKYFVYQLYANGLIKRNASDPISNIFLFSNFVFIRKDLNLNSNFL